MTETPTCAVCGRPAEWIAAKNHGEDAAPDAAWQYACNSASHLDLAGIDLDGTPSSQLADLAEILCDHPNVNRGVLDEFLATFRRRP